MAFKELYKYSINVFSSLNKLPSIILFNRLNNTLLTSSNRKYSQNNPPGVRDCLMEFFDVETNWNKGDINVGRSWRKDELRIKSNEDLHKLWYVLLKERNMLLTMEEECRRNLELFPSPERLNKVKESMVNLEDVVRERNKAYYMLETGTTGERTGKVVNNQLGLKCFYKAKEHWQPKPMMGWAGRHRFWYRRRECEKFLPLLREKLFLEKRKARVRDRNHVAGLLKRFPDIDIDFLKEAYPSVNVERVMKTRRADGHFVH